jgi:plastocyanin
MTRRVRHAVVAIAALAFLPASAAHGDDPPVLTAIVGTNDAFVITLNDATGKKVSELVTGTYTVLVKDQSTIHNFRLASNEDPDVDFRTDLEFVGEKSFTVTFKASTVYAYACEPHWQTMSGNFFVTGQPGPPPPPPPAAPRLRTLRATVTAAGGVRLSSSSVRAGRYKIVVADRARRHNFHLRGRGVNKRTGARFMGSVTWRVRLARGTYRYGSDSAVTKKLRVR